MYMYMYINIPATRQIGLSSTTLITRKTKGKTRAWLAFTLAFTNNITFSHATSNVWAELTVM